MTLPRDLDRRGGEAVFDSLPEVVDPAMHIRAPITG